VSARDEIAKQTGADVRAVAADVSQKEGIVAVTSAALSAFGRVDILVTNAGGPPAGIFEMHDWDIWQRAVDLTLRSAVELTRTVLPGMRLRRWGRVIHVTSIAAKQPVDNLMLSNSIRAAVTGFSRTLANEVAADGVTVNTLIPGYTRTERGVGGGERHEGEHDARRDHGPVRARDPDAPPRRAPRVRRARRLRRIGARELHHRTVDRGRRWLDSGTDVGSAALLNRNTAPSTLIPRAARNACATPMRRSGRCRTRASTSTPRLA